MKVFGVIPIGQAEGDQEIFVQAGWTDDPNHTAVKIIDMDGMDSDQKTAFIDDFRKIASNPVGRELLYRILIEIRRYKDKDGVRVGAIGADVLNRQSAPLLKERNNCRKINIIWSDDRGSFSQRGKIKYTKSRKKLTTLCELVGSNHPICLLERETSIGLFHEITHWFHLLRCPNRFNLEAGGYDKQIKLHDSTDQKTLGAYFWGGIASGFDDNWKVSATPWVDHIFDKGHLVVRSYVNFEEIRTILGAPTETQYYHNNIASDNPTNNTEGYIYLNGDALSENKYRVSLGAKIRFGHSTQPFYEDKKVIARVILISGGANNLVDLATYNQLDRGSRPENKIGLGNFRIGGYNTGNIVP